MMMTILLGLLVSQAGVPSRSGGTAGSGGGVPVGWYQNDGGYDALSRPMWWSAEGQISSTVNSGGVIVANQMGGSGTLLSPLMNVTYATIATTTTQLSTNAGNRAHVWMGTMAANALTRLVYPEQHPHMKINFITQNKYTDGGTTMPYVRWWCGWGNGIMTPDAGGLSLCDATTGVNIGGTACPAEARYCMFRASGSAGDTTWQLCSADGVGADSCIDSTIPATESTEYHIEVSMGPGSCTGNVKYIGSGVGATIMKTTNIPAYDGGTSHIEDAVCYSEGCRNMLYLYCGIINIDGGTNFGTPGALPRWSIGMLSHTWN